MSIIGNSNPIGGYYPTTSQTSGSQNSASTSQGSSATTPNVNALQAYYNSLQNAANVASQPYEPYQGQLVAGFTPSQVAAFQGFQNAVDIQQPYLQGAQNLYNQMYQYSNPSDYFNQIGNYYDPLNQIANPYLQQAAQYQQNQFNLLNPENYATGIATYSNPYQSQVVDATLGQLGQLQNQLINKNTANAIRQGTYGGSGEFMGQAEVARQQGLANAQTLAQLNAQNYENAQRQYNTQQGLGISANQQAIANALNQAGLRTGLYNQAGSQYGVNRQVGMAGAASAAQGLTGLGQQAQQGTLSGLSALLQGGTLQQQQAQNQLNAAYNQWLQAKAFPYQQAAYYSGLVGGVAPLMGAYQNTTGSGTSNMDYSGSSISMQPYANQSGGGGILGALTAGAGIASNLLKLKSGGRAVSKQDRKNYASGGIGSNPADQAEGDTPVAVKTTNVSLGNLGDLISEAPYSKGQNAQVAKAAGLTKIIPAASDTAKERLADAIKKSIEDRAGLLSAEIVGKPSANTSKIAGPSDFFGGGSSGEGGLLGGLGDIASKFLTPAKSEESSGSSGFGSGLFDSLSNIFKADGGRVGYADGGGQTITELMRTPESKEMNAVFKPTVGSFDELLAQAKSKGPGPQKTPVQQGRVAMPDSVYYRKRLPTFGFTQPTVTTTDSSGTIGPSMSSQVAAMQAAAGVKPGTPAASLLTSGSVPSTGTTGMTDASTPRTGENITFPDSAGVYAGTTITPAQKDIMNAAYLDQYAFINDMYSQYLGRRPTAAEAQKWVAAMGAGGAGTPGTGTEQQEYGTLPSNLTPMQVQNWFATHSTERINALKPVVQGYYERIANPQFNPETGLFNMDYSGEYYSPGYTSQLSDVQTTSDPFFSPYAPGVPESAHAEGAVIPNIPGKTDRFGNPIKKAAGGRVAKKGGGSFDPYDPTIDKIANGIAAIESGGRYHITGPRSKRGDMPYGKYQIMGSNIPKWGAEAGYPGLTPSQFLASPKIQEDVARHQFAKIYSRTGDPTHVAGEWLGGPGWRSNKHADVLGTTVPAYIQRFNAAFKGSPSEKGVMLAKAPSSMSPISEKMTAENAVVASDETSKPNLGELLGKVLASQEEPKENTVEVERAQPMEPMAPMAPPPNLADMQQMAMLDLSNGGSNGKNLYDILQKPGRAMGGRLRFQDGGSGWLDSLLGSEANPATRDYKTREELSSPEEEQAYAAAASATGIPGLDYARSILRGLGKEVSGADMGAFGQQYQNEMARYRARKQEAERLKREYPEAYRGGHLAGSEYAPGAEAGFFMQPGLSSATRGAVQRASSNPIYRASNAAFERPNPNVKYDFGNIMEGENPALKVKDNSQGWHLYDRPAYGEAPKDAAVPFGGPSKTYDVNWIDQAKERIANSNLPGNQKQQMIAYISNNPERARYAFPDMIEAIAQQNKFGKRMLPKYIFEKAGTFKRLGDIQPVATSPQALSNEGFLAPRQMVPGKRTFSPDEIKNVTPRSASAESGLDSEVFAPTEGMNYEKYGKVPLKAHELRRQANQNLGPVEQEAIDELEAFRAGRTPSRTSFRPTDFEGGVEASGEAPSLFKPKDTVRTEGSTENMAPGSLNFGVMREGYQAPNRKFALPSYLSGDKFETVKKGAKIGTGLGAMSAAAILPGYIDGLQQMADQKNKRYVSPLTGDPNRGFQELVQYPDQKVKFPSVYGSVNPYNNEYPTEPSMNPERQAFRQDFDKLRQPMTTDFMGNKPRVVANETEPTQAAKPRKARSSTTKAKSSESGEKYWGDWRDAPGFAEDPIGGFFDSLMGETKSSSKKGHLAYGGVARSAYANGGGRQEEDFNPLSAIGEGIGQLGDAIGEGFGSLFGVDEQPKTRVPAKSAPKERVVAAEPEPSSPGLFSSLGSGGSNVLGDSLIAAGLGMMASPARDPLRAVGEGGLTGFKYYQAAQEEQRKRDILREQQRQNADVVKSWQDGGDLGSLPEKTAASDADTTPGSTSTRAPATVPSATTPTAPKAPTTAAADDEIYRLIEQHQQRIARIAGTPVSADNPMLEKQKKDSIEAEKISVEMLKDKLAAAEKRKEAERKEREGSPSGKGEEAFSKKMAEDQVKEISELQKLLPTAQGMVDRTTEVINALKNNQIYQSPTGFEIAKTRRNVSQDYPVLAPFIGLDKEDEKRVKNTEMLDALATKDLLQQIGGSLGSQISDADRATIEKAAAQIGKSKEVNIQQLEVLKKAMQRAQERGELMRKYSKEHGSLYGYLEYERENLNHQPMYDEKTYKEYNVDPKTSTYKPGGLGGEFDSLDAEMRRRGLL